MGFNTPDWQQPATVVGGAVGVKSPSQAEPRAAQAVSQAAPYVIPISAGREVSGYLLNNLGAIDAQYSLDAGVTWLSLPAGAHLGFTFAGAVRVRSASASASATLDLVAFEV